MERRLVYVSSVVWRMNQQKEARSNTSSQKCLGLMALVELLDGKNYKL